MFQSFPILGTEHLELLLYLDIILTLFTQEIYLLRLNIFNLEHIALDPLSHVT